MKKISLIFIIFVLMINCLIVNIQATEESSDQVNENNTTIESEDTNSGLIKKNAKTVDAKAKVLEAGEVKKQEVGTIVDTIQEIKLEIITGEYKGEEYTTNYVLSYDIEGKIMAYELSKGDKVVVQLSEDNEGNVSITVQNVVRSGYIYLMFIIFLLSIVIVAGKQGVKAIIGLIVTILAIYLVLIKGIYRGADAILYSILTSIIVIVLTFIIIGGINKKIFTAAIGTLGGVVSAGIMAVIFNYLAKMSGACEEAIQLSINMSEINFQFRDLLFAGIIVSALGACMDVGMSIASSLDEIKSKKSDITGIELFKSGMNIGKDVIGTMTNTLILAYVGGSLTLILLFMACNMEIQDILNKEVIAQEFISALAGSMGVIYTVPITSFVFSVLNKDKTVYKKTSENKIEGKRSLKI